MSKAEEKYCKACTKTLPIEHFRKKRALCRTCYNAVARERSVRYRRENREEISARRQANFAHIKALRIACGRTVEGRIKKMYALMRIRTRNNPMYQNRPMLVSFDRFRQLCFERWNIVNLMERWKASGFARRETPSVDRIDNSGPYSEENIQIISVAENSRKMNLVDYHDRYLSGGHNPSSSYRKITHEVIGAIESMRQLGASLEQIGKTLGIKIHTLYRIAKRDHPIFLEKSNDTER